MKHPNTIAVTRKTGISALSIIIGVILTFLFSGCSLFDRFFGDKKEKTADELMTDGLKKMEMGSYQEAVDAFQKVKDRYPYSQFAITAELNMADALYDQESYDEAFDAYDGFEKLHPKNQQIPYVIYRKGMSHFGRVKTIDRDQTHTLKAKEEFERLIKRFPRDDYANRARKNLRKCLIYLAEYELYVGHYYYNMGMYRAAMARYTYLVKNYPDMGQYHEALEYISRCEERLRQTEKSKEEEKPESKTSRLWRKLNPFD